MINTISDAMSVKIIIYFKLEKTKPSVYK